MAETNKKLGCAIFGAGWVAGEHARAYQCCSRTRLVAVGSRKEESARKCAEYAGVKDAFITTDFDALLRRPDVDVISITTPPDIHALDAMRWFAGNDNAVQEVTAYSTPHHGDSKDWGYDPTTVLICKFASGAIGKTASILDCKMPYQFNIDVVGTKGTIRDNRVWSEQLFPGQTAWATIPTILPDSGDVTHHPFNGQIEAFVASIQDGKACLPDINDAVKTHELIFAADRS